MKTEHLIDIIAQDAAANVPSIRGRLLVATVVGCAATALALVMSLGVRPDLGTALTTWRFDAKLMFVALLCGGTWIASRELTRPEADMRKIAAYVAGPCLLLVGLMAAELMATPATTWATRAIGSNSRLCLVAVAAFAVAPLLVLLAVLRDGAPRLPFVAGAVAGLLAGSIGALFYALHCPDDSPLFVALWYTPPILLATLAGAVLGRSSLRW